MCYKRTNTKENNLISQAKIKLENLFLKATNVGGI